MNLLLSRNPIQCPKPIVNSSMCGIWWHNTYCDTEVTNKVVDPFLAKLSYYNEQSIICTISQQKICQSAQMKHFLSENSTFIIIKWRLRKKWYGIVTSQVLWCFFTLLVISVADFSLFVHALEAVLRLMMCLAQINKLQSGSGFTDVTTSRVFFCHFMGYIGSNKNIDNLWPYPLWDDLKKMYLTYMDQEANAKCVFDY